ncbi:MAG: hypothetical protein QME28_08400 [Candidatus Saccharicenans sp.]|nr:hypothetical protein [Candidatus Saccharicenans sp.]
MWIVLRPRPQARSSLQENFTIPFFLAGCRIPGNLSRPAPRASSFAERVRAPGVPMVIGGPHVSLLPDEALE